MLRCPQCRALVADDLDHCPDDGTELEEASDSRLGLLLEGDIQLQDVAGGGAMGSVFIGWQAAMERRVAVKMLHGDLSRDEVFVERFLREARAVARLNHPNIVTVHAVGEAAGSHYIVMEFIEGETLSEHIKRGPVSSLRTMRIARQIASALADAHASGIIHRDLKPANVLLSQRRRAADFVKILDFGVAKIVDADSQLTRDGFVFGTPAYLSPEQANGVDLDGRADLYSLGVIMHEMLSGKLPFEGNQVQLLLKHAKETAPPLLSRAPSVEPELAALIDRLLAKSPDVRPRNAEALADDLDDLLGGGNLSPWASGALRASGRPAVQTRQAPQQSIVDATGATAAMSAPPERTSDGAWSQNAEAAVTAETALSTPTAKKLARRTPSRPVVTVALLVFAGVALLGAGGSAVAFGPLRTKLPIYALGVTAPATNNAPRPGPGSSVIPASEVRYDVPRVALMFSQEGYSLRIQHPETIELGSTYEITIDVWGPSGEPVDVDEIDATLIGPGTRAAADAFATATRGSYAIRRVFDVVGDHTLAIFPPAAESSVEVRLTVVPKA